ncbi:MAG: UDP-N-acetylglucosamine-N-acetylmuramyl-(pentapeptide) pyrophosphoryl-UDP N-acetylglucosamine transferase [Parcubacteria group bacterium GW2011_GWA2_51_12]|nr:MAG: UDP-N-acetylglucosamine-N-acetylmuramyl-(pentapeptide) pyrophosphoryl-UDP N-acetylglucosamine transferase [Parcubacteria group bacterium GW2011_GWA2_51_12]
MKMLIVGGGTGGPTAPLFAVAEKVKKRFHNAEFVFLGTRKGVDKKFTEQAGFSVVYHTIPAGKWRRPFTIENIFDLFKIFFGFLKALYYLGRYRPDVVFGAGSYAQVPVAYAAYLRRIPVVIHQPDLRLLLSTRVVAPIAKAITVSFTNTGQGIGSGSGLLAKYPKSKVHVTGNPVRESVLGGSVEKARSIFNLNDQYPTILVMGGGTGARRINELVWGALPELSKYAQIIHLTGGKDKSRLPTRDHYHPFDFLTGDLKHAYAVADIVISRAGMATISELGLVGKAVVLIPLPDSPQEDNAKLLASFGLAVAVNERSLTPINFTELVRKLLWDTTLQKNLRENIKRLMPADSAEKIAKVIHDVYERSK